MASVVYNTLSAFTPIDLQYNFFKNENFKKTLTTYRNGYTFFLYDSLANYQDVIINNSSCFILTSSIKLNSVFTEPQSLFLGTIPGTFQLQLSTDNVHFLSYNNGYKTFKQVLSVGSNFYAQPVVENTIELFVNNQYVQVDAEYPYTVRLNPKSLDPEEIHRQRFEIIYQGGFIVFKTLTNSGYRFLGVGIDNTLRATGLILGVSVINDYVFKCIPVTNLSNKSDFIPTNNWVTYYFDIESGKNNSDLVVNKKFDNISTNFLINFPIETSFKTAKAEINIANLKTAITPVGGPTPVENSYTATTITTN
jgi:hypothetical protein